MKTIYIHENLIIRKRYELQPIELILFSIIIIHSIMPIVGRTISKFLTTYFLLAIVLLICLLSIMWKRGGWILNVSSLLGIEMINAINKFMNDGSITKIIFALLLDLCLIFIAFVYQELTKRQQNQIFRITMIALFVTFFTTLVGVIRNPQAARFLATVAADEGEYSVSLSWQNVGGFSFVYMVVVLYPLLISSIKANQKSLWLKLVVVGVVAYFFMKVEYATALLIIAATTILWFVPKRMRFSQVVAIAIILAICVLILLEPAGKVIAKIASRVGSFTLRERILYLSDSMRGVHNSSDVGRRTEMLMMSLESFITHPILGTWLVSGSYVGGHSFILDFAAMYGMPGLALIILSYWQIYKHFYKPHVNSTHYTYAMCAFVIAIILSCLNPGNHWFEIVFVVPMMFFTKEMPTTDNTNNQIAGVKHESTLAM